MRLIDADALKNDIMSYKTMPEIRKAICEVIDNAPTIKPCDNCDLYFMAKTKEEMKKGGAV